MQRFGRPAAAIVAIVVFALSSLIVAAAGRFAGPQSVAQPHRTFLPLIQTPPDEEDTRSDELDDLEVTRLDLTPAYPLPGESVDAAVVVRNRANHRSQGVVVALLAGTTRVASRQVDVEAGATITVHLPWTAAGAGSRTVLAAVVDPDRRLAERTRIDNTVTREAVVAAQPPAAADFAVTGLDLVELPDHPTTLRARVLNGGSAPGSAPLIVRAGSEILAVTSVGPLPPGRSTLVDVTLPGGEPPASVSAEVNPRFRSLEPHPNDNLFVRSLTPAVDLRVERLSVSALQPEDGRPRQVTISFRVANAGQLAITTPFRTSVSPGAVGGDISPILITSYVSTPGLAAGQSTYVSLSLVSPVNAFDVRVEADADHVIPEADEANNVAVAHYQSGVAEAGRWVSIGPRRMTGSIAQGYGWDDAGGMLSSIAIPPTTPATIYVGSNATGVWKTTDAGGSWQSVSDSLPTLDISALAVDPTTPSRVYAATPSGVFRSEDGGTSWLLVSGTAALNLYGCCEVLLVDPSNTATLYLTSFDGVYRSLDRGATWVLVKRGGQATDLVMDRTNPRVLYAALNHATDFGVTGIYQTTDGGTNWTKLQGCPGGSLPAVTSNTGIELAMSGSTLFARYRSATSLDVYRSSGFGCSIGGRLDVQFAHGWSTNQPATFWSDLEADPADPRFVYLTGTDFWRSTDGGNTFNLTAGLGSPPHGAHSDHHGFAADPSSPNVIYTVNDGGIYRSANRGASNSWDFVGDGITNVDFYDVANAATAPSLMIGGTQDNGTQRYNGTSTVWTHIRGGDGATVDIDPTDAGILYSMGQYADSIGKSTNGSGFVGLPRNLPAPSACFNLHYQVHPRATSTLLASCGSLWRSSNVPPGDWQPILTPASGSIVRSAVDRTVDLYYAAASDGRLYAGPGGAAWQTVFTHAPAVGISDVEIDPDDPTVVYATFGGTGAGRVYRLRRTSAAPSSMPAADITADLPPGIGVNTIAVDRMAPQTIYAGTDQGVYRGRSIDGGTTWSWTPFNNGMPPAKVVDLEVHPQTGVMRAATFGRSAFEVNTGAPLGSVLAAEGKITLLRVHDVGTAYGPPTDRLDAEAIIWLDSQPGMAFGFQLREDANEDDHHSMLDLLRDAFKHNRRVRVDYIRTGLRNERILRVMDLP